MSKSPYEAGTPTQHDLRQEALAERAGIHRVSVPDIEARCEVPTLDTLALLTRALRVPLARLLA